MRIFPYIAVEAKIRTFLNPEILMPFTIPSDLFPIPDSSSAIFNLMVLTRGNYPLFINELIAEVLPKYSINAWELVLDRP